MIDQEMVKGLMEEFKTSDLTKLKLKCEAFELVLEREKEVVYTAGGVSAAAQTAFVGNAATQSDAIQNDSQAKEQKGHALVAPLVGTFYSAESPESEPFVQVGSKVKKGDTVAIIEAMKLMNEVEADKDGEILEILVQNGEMVECNQPMFIIG